MAQLKKGILGNSANMVTIIRLAAVLAAALFLVQDNIPLRKGGLFILVCVFLLDGLDGFLARKLNVSNNVGALMDTLADRVAENVVLVVFAYKKMIPLFIPLVFITRSFIADFIRSLAFRKGIGSFAINKSRFGFYVVASKSSRSIYLVLKFLVFLLGGFMIAYPALAGCAGGLPMWLFYLALALTTANLTRFAGLVFDSRKILKEAFSQEKYEK